MTATARIGSALLQVRLALSRLGSVTVIAVLLCVGGTLCWLLWIPHLQAELDSRSAALQRARLALHAGPPHPAPDLATPQAAFYGTLGDRYRSEDSLHSLFEIARASGLTLAKGEYKAVYDRNSEVYKYQVLLPVTGPYGAIRSFCEQALREMPYASLDEISFRRETVENGALDARLRFTLHLKEMPRVRAKAGAKVDAGADTGADSRRSDE